MTDFKPGDVAILPANLAEPRTVFLTIHRGWVDTDGDPRAAADNYPDDLRRLVVIDPEDREQVERLIARLVDGQFWKVIPADVEGVTHRTGQMQAALREFATPTPPKPAEPTGLGAVVEDADGRHWTLLPPHVLYRRWACWGEPVADRAYDQINAVRVLSEGVTNA